MFEKGADPSHVMEEEGLEKIEGDSQIEKLVQEIIKENSSAVADYRRGKEESLQFLLGQLMRKTRGQIDPQLAKEKLQQLLQSN